MSGLLTSMSESEGRASAMQEGSAHECRLEAPMRRETPGRNKAVRRARGEELRIQGREVLESGQGKAVRSKADPES